MRYQLFGSKGSGSGIVELALAEIGADHELHELALEAQQQRSGEYARLNPQRKIPTLITPEGETLTESSAIVLVLDERHPEAKLLPERATPARAQALRWLAFLAAELYPIIEICDYPERFAPDAATAAGVREVAQGIWRERWLVLENAIAGSPWLLPSGFCWTDVYLAVLSRWLPADWRAEHLPRVERIARGIAERERIAAVWQRHHGPAR